MGITFSGIWDAIKAVVGRAPMTRAAVESALDKAADAHAEDLNWRTSIVDLQKTLGQPHDIESRVALAAELGMEGYSGKGDENMELHRLVMAEVANRYVTVPKG